MSITCSGNLTLLLPTQFWIPTIYIHNFISTFECDFYYWFCQFLSRSNIHSANFLNSRKCRKKVTAKCSIFSSTTYLYIPNTYVCTSFVRRIILPTNPNVTKYPCFSKHRKNTNNMVPKKRYLCCLKQGVSPSQVFL